jgi:preprotein translocase subunit SecE
MGENTAKEAAPKAPKKSWFKGLKAEFKKIVWPDKKSLARESAAVVVSAIALGIIIKILDVVINYGIEFLMGL